MEQQLEASTLGMWLFLVTEVMFFGGLFMAYLLYRIWYPAGVVGRQPRARHPLGGFNTVVLIGSSLTMALAVRAAQTGWRKGTIWYLVGTMVLGLTFLVVKFFEYKHKYDHHHIPGPNFAFEGPYGDQVEIFMSLYFAMTGLHALHMVIGFGILSVILWMACKNRFSPEWYTPVEMSGSLLALRRHRLDLPVPAALPRGPGASLRRSHVSTRPSQEHLLRHLRRADGADRRSRSAVAFVNLGSLNFPVAIAHRHHQGDARRAVLHAREVQQPPDEDGRRHRHLLPDDRCSG